MASASPSLSSLPPLALLHLFWLLLLLGVAEVGAQTNCRVNITTPNLQSSHYNGSWFVVARKAPTRDYLPTALVTSSMIKLVVDEANGGQDLIMNQYFISNGTCHGPRQGRWYRQPDGQFLLNTTDENGTEYLLMVRAIFHSFSGENLEEMNMVLYGCRVFLPSGECAAREQLVLIMSNSRHPQTMQLFKSAKHIEDFACIDILLLRTLDTYSSCGDEEVDEDQRLVHAQVNADAEFIDVECKMENARSMSIDGFFDEPRVLTVVAYMDESLNDEPIFHISCHYISSTEATCEWIRQENCFHTRVQQRFVGENQIAATAEFVRANGTPTTLDWSGTVLWHNGDEYISYACLSIGVGNACDSWRVFVWSDEDHMDQPTIREIYHQLHSMCIDPTDLIFLNTFHECVEGGVLAEPDVECGAQPAWRPVSPAFLEGVWYFAADLNAPYKIYLQSALVQLTALPESDNSTVQFAVSFYAQKEAGDRECIGPGNGTATLDLTNSTLRVSVEYRYTLVPKYRSTLEWTDQIIYLDNQRLVLYRCLRTAANGRCLQKDVDVLVRERHFSHNDLSLIRPYLTRACVSADDDLRWFDLHSSCGYEVGASTRLRRTLVTLSHSEVLDVLTNVQEPRCKYPTLPGRKADLHALEKGGWWYLQSRFDELTADTYALVARLHAIDETTAVVRIVQKAAEPGEPAACVERVFTLTELGDRDGDVYYKLSFESPHKNSTMLLVRFLFVNSHTAVVYSCLGYTAESTCRERLLYVLSRHESIAHVELSILDQVAKAVCLPPESLFHTAKHDTCVVEPARRKAAPDCRLVENRLDDGDTTLRELDNVTEAQLYGSHVYYSVAASDTEDPEIPIPFAMKRQENGSWSVYLEEDGHCVSRPAGRVRWAAAGAPRLLGAVGSRLVLFEPAGRASAAARRAAQLSLPHLPCLQPIDLTPLRESPPVNKIPQEERSCASILKLPNCSLPTSAVDISKTAGDWVLYASDPLLVSNSRCSAVLQSQPNEASTLWTCQHESYAGACLEEERLRLVLLEPNSSKYDMFLDNSTTPTPAPAVVPAVVRRTSGRASFYPQTADEPLALALVSDLPLGGPQRRYAVWKRADAPIADFETTELRNWLRSLCIFPTAVQTHSLENGCAAAAAAATNA